MMADAFKELSTEGREDEIAPLPLHVNGLLSALCHDERCVGISGCSPPALVVLNPSVPPLSQADKPLRRCKDALLESGS